MIKICYVTCSHIDENFETSMLKKTINHFYFLIKEVEDAPYKVHIYMYGAIIT